MQVDFSYEFFNIVLVVILLPVSWRDELVGSSTITGQKVLTKSDKKFYELIMLDLRFSQWWLYNAHAVHWLSLDYMALYPKR
jgi:hypothetical protein